jgi:hypothetical protein
MSDSSFTADDEPAQSGGAGVADMFIALALTAAAAIVVIVAVQLW